MIDALFAYAGLDDEYADAFGNPAVVSRESKVAILNALGYAAHDDASADAVLRLLREKDQTRRVAPVYVLREGMTQNWPATLRAELAPETPPGYYDVEIGGDLTRAIVVPARAFVPPSVDEAPRWGIGAQLYALRSNTNWGIGDFGDLATLARIARNAGASFLGLNPLHQLHLIHPQNASPYAPLSRRFFNALYIDVDRVAAQHNVRLDRSRLPSLREVDFVDYHGVAREKLNALEHIFNKIAIAKELKAFERSHPSARAVATYEALAEHFLAADASIGSWLQWPQEFRTASSPDVVAFAKRHARRIRFFLFLQWLADAQLAAAARAADAMAVGLYCDLAVGVDLGSADVWSDPSAYVLGLSVGAPPDPLNAHGQNWGLPPLHPRALVDRAYEPFITLLQANMRHAGALRIDHVMGLKRLFCIPRDLPEGGGAYLNYDFEAMLGILALESHRNACMVVGEDLGTVPEGFRERIGEERVFSCRVLYFETEHERYREVEAYPADAVASTGTHDLPPFAAYWMSLDEPSRAILIEALKQAGCLSEAAHEPSLDEALDAVYRFLAKTNSRLVLAQLEDMLAQREQVNVPGTTTEEPNWKRRYSTPIEALNDHQTFAAISRILREERPLERRELA